MDRVFSVDDIADQFWSPPAPPIHSAGAAKASDDQEESTETMMNRSSSEWAFQRFLQEASASEPSPPPPPPPPPSSAASAYGGGGGGGGGGAPSSRGENDVVEIKDHHPRTTAATTTSYFDSDPPKNIPVGSEEYQAFLKSRLNLACAAVALTRASYVKTQDSAAAVADNGSQVSSTSQLGSQAPCKASEFDLSKREYKDVGGPLGNSSLPDMHKKPVVQVRSTTSGSSRELSDDDEFDGDMETTQNLDPHDAKRVRRMLSNRESARRSRRRKQAHLTELETEAGQLRVENSSLLKRLTDISQKYNEAAVDNRILKADVETMRAKVKMAEESVKRVTGLNPLLQAMSEMALPFAGSPFDTSADAAVPVQDDRQQQNFHQPTSSTNQISSIHEPRIQNQNGLRDNTCVENVQQNNPTTAASAVGGNKMDRTGSMQRVASLEHLQKRIRGGAGSSCGMQGTGE